LTSISITSALREEDDGTGDLGEVYTNPIIASFLVKWAVSSGTKRILEPGCGDAVFLRTAAQLIKQGKLNPAVELIGVELSSIALRQAQDKFAEFERVKVRMFERNFFDVSKDELGPVDVVAGNPPFIRHHKFKGYRLQTAVERCLEAGVNLPRTASSWAYFLVYACTMLRPGGRMAMVVPEELLVAEYSRSIWKFLSGQFERILILSPRDPIFRSVIQKTVLLLGDNAGRGPAVVSIASFPGIHSMERVRVESLWPRARTLAVSDLTAGKSRASEYLIPADIVRLYRNLVRHIGVAKICSFGSVRIGYVTGDNEFFILTKDEVESWSIHSDFLSPTICETREIDGLKFALIDWATRFSSGHARALLRVPQTAWKSLPYGVQAYLEFGKRHGVMNRYHCRAREPWYSIRNVRGGALILKSLGVKPPFVAWNVDSISASNSLNQVFIDPISDSLLPEEIAVASLTSLTYLSTRIEGHRLSGGLLKLEPREANRVVIVSPKDDSVRKEMRALVAPLQAWLRNGQLSYALEKTDELLLEGYLGLSKRTRHALIQAANRVEQSGRGRQKGSSRKVDNYW
jgi:adenine-specific DNA-methyltransferase